MPARHRPVDPGRGWLASSSAAASSSGPRWPPLSRSSLLNGFYVIAPEEIGIIAALRTQAPALRRARACTTSCPGPSTGSPASRPRRVRVVEIGFRTNAAAPDAEPAAYEWNVQHRSGRFQRKPEESLMLTGDQNMIELNATVHYDLVAARRVRLRPARWRSHRALRRRIGACSR